MPVAQKPSICLEDNSCSVPTIGTFPADFYEDLKSLLDSISRFEEEEREDRKKTEKLAQHIKAAEDLTVKAEAKRDALQKRVNFLRTTLDERRQIKRDALQYWKDYGFDVVEVPTQSEASKEYDFIFTNLGCTLRLQFLDQTLKIISQQPDRLNQSQLDELNTRLTSNCVGQDGVVDYKLAMLMIRKDLNKTPPT